MSKTISWAERRLSQLPVKRAALNKWRSEQARPNQLMPSGEWRTWLLLAGRGFGKTRASSEAVRELIEVYGHRRIHLVGRTVSDVRDVMVGGDSGLLGLVWDQGPPTYIPSRRRLEWPNGAVALTFSADEPDQLRGPQSDATWCDEVATMSEDVLSNAKMGLRLGHAPKMILSTTPRPTQLIRDQASDPHTVVTTGATSDNTDNLAPGFVQEIYRLYGGTRLGDQELSGQILSDVQGALWSYSDIRHGEPVKLSQVYIGVDPATTSTEGSDETGIIVVGLGIDNVAYVLEDQSGRMTPREWAETACDMYRKWRNRGDYVKIIAESNQGGDMVRETILSSDRSVLVDLVRATGTKAQRAFPVSVLYQRSRVVHVKGLAKLEDQMTSWTPNKSGKSPDRIDALVWGVSPILHLLQSQAVQIREENPGEKEERRILTNLERSHRYAQNGRSNGGW